MRLTFLLLLGIRLFAQPYVFVATCGTDAACDKLKNLLASAADSKVAERIATDRGLYFGEPNCEAAGVSNRRCAWSHEFSLTASDKIGLDSDQTWLLKRMDAVASQFGLTPAQLRSRITIRNSASVSPLPSDWRYPEIK